MDQMEGANACDLQQYTVVVEKMTKNNGVRSTFLTVFLIKGYKFGIILTADIVG